MFKRIFRVAAATLVFVFCVAAARAEVRIGVALPRTGPLASIGEQIANGVTAAAKAINENAPEGEKIVLDIEDDACDPKQAVSVANKFVTEKIGLVVGHVCSGASITASDIYAENGVLMMTAASNSAKLTERGLPAIFRVCGRDDQQGRLAAQIIAQRFPGKSIAIIHDKSPFAKGLADATKDNLNQLGIREALYEAINPGERDYSALITRLKAAKIDLVYYGGYQQEMGQLLRQAQDADFHPQFFGTSGIATSELWAIAGAAAEGVLFTFTPDPRKRPEASSAVSALRAQNLEPEGFTLYAYAAVQLIAAAIHEAHSTDPKRVEAALKSSRFNSVLGEVAFDAKGDVNAPGYVLYAWRGGKYDYAN
jgi:branched-chain amino acid transport system substrate-binding protein